MRTERDLKNVLTLSREVRIRMNDASVIYASVVGEVTSESFVVRPWGIPTTITIRFDDVSSARPVSKMGWHEQRKIGAAQGAAHVPGG